MWCCLPYHTDQRNSKLLGPSRDRHSRDSGMQKQKNTKIEHDGLYDLQYLAGGFKYIYFVFTLTLPGEIIDFDIFFSNELVQPPARYVVAKS